MTEQEQEMYRLIERADTFVGACEGLKVGIAHEESPSYRRYLANTVLPFLEDERVKANEECARYRREHFKTA